MNKVGIYYAYWTRNWDTDFHPFIDRVANLGFDILEVNAGTIAKMTYQERLSLKAWSCEFTDVNCIYAGNMAKANTPCEKTHRHRN